MTVLRTIACWYAIAGPLSAQSDWALLQLPGSPFRTEVPLTYDTTRNVTFLFGGNQSPNGFANDLWSYDGLAWTQVATSPGPLPRRNAVFVADPARRELLLFGGDGGPGNDTWTWNGGWTQRFPATMPPRRNRAGATYDTARNVVVMFGGQGAQFWPPLADFWQWNGVDWQQLPGTTPTPARGAPGLAYDSVRDRVVMFGGYQSTNSLLGDTWEWDGVTWRLRATTGPSPRLGGGLLFDEHRQRTVLTGGFLLPLGGDTWEWDGDRWRQIATTNQPANWAYPGMAYDRRRRRVVQYGSGTDTWEYGNLYTGHSIALGHGCAGPSGVPELRVTGSAWPQLGSVFPIEVVGLRATATTVVAMTGFSRTDSACGPLPLDLAGYGMSGCILFVDPLVASALPAQGGVALHPITVPNDPGLLGCRFFEQILQPEPTGPRPASFSNALEFVIG